tara:strand:- start:247 stop:669 length:423 start_codon:yes stop_codon:yes gene_type:complete
MLQYADLIGVPFAYNGRGPDTYDCYGLNMEIYRRLGVKVPDVRSPTDLDDIAAVMGFEKTKWTTLWTKEGIGDAPSHADMPVGATLMFNVNGRTSHVGIVVRPGRFLHAWEHLGGVAEERISLWRRRIEGIYRFDGFSPN